LIERRFYIAWEIAGEGRNQGSRKYFYIPAMKQTEMKGNEKAQTEFIYVIDFSEGITWI
jgi:hypothetical protein